MARSLTVILLLLQSTTHCGYRVYTKFLLTYIAIYWGNCKVLLLGITALQPQSHFHLGTPYRCYSLRSKVMLSSQVFLNSFIYYCERLQGTANVYKVFSQARQNCCRNLTCVYLPLERNKLVGIKKIEWFLEVMQETVAMCGTDSCRDCQNSSFGTF